MQMAWFFLFCVLVFLIRWREKTLSVLKEVQTPHFAAMANAEFAKSNFILSVDLKTKLLLSILCLAISLKGL